MRWGYQAAGRVSSRAGLNAERAVRAPEQAKRMGVRH